MNSEIEQLKAMIAAGRPAGPQSLDARRARMEEMAKAFPPPANVTFDHSERGGVPVLIAEPAAGTDTDTVLLYFHGGGYVSGSVRTHRNFAGELALRTGLGVVSVDYRLAPEHIFPAALDDALAVYLELVRSHPVVLAGDSAGGGLALALALERKALGRGLPERLALLCPWIDLTCTNPTFAELAEHDPIIDHQSLAEDAGRYLGDTDARNPRASPLFADLAGLPPLLIQAAGHDSLVGEARELAARAEAAGVETHYREYPEMVHVFQIFHAMLTPGWVALDEAAAFLKGD